MRKTAVFGGLGKAVVVAALWPTVAAAQSPGPALFAEPTSPPAVSAIVENDASVDSGSAVALPTPTPPRLGTLQALAEATRRRGASLLGPLPTDQPSQAPARHPGAGWRAASAEPRRLSPGEDLRALEAVDSPPAVEPRGEVSSGSNPAAQWLQGSQLRPIGWNSTAASPQGSNPLRPAGGSQGLRFGDTGHNPLRAGDQ